MLAYKYFYSDPNYFAAIRYRRMQMTALCAAAEGASLFRPTNHRFPNPKS